MINLTPSKNFLKDTNAFKKNAIMRKKIVKALKLLQSNPQHPGLNLERFVNDKTAWSIRVDRKYRISIEPLQQNDPQITDWSKGIFLLRILDHDDLYHSPH